MRFITSDRLERFVRKTPFMAEVTATLPGLWDPADRHAGVGRLDDHRDALHVQLLQQQVGDLLGHPLLHLGAVGDVLHDPRELAESRPRGRWGT